MCVVKYESCDLVNFARIISGDSRLDLSKQLKSNMELDGIGKSDVDEEDLVFNIEAFVQVTDFVCRRKSPPTGGDFRRQTKSVTCTGLVIDLAQILLDDRVVPNSH